MSKKVLFALTSHDTLGSTGRRTGFYVPEVAHPAAVFREAGYEIAYVSVRGGAAPQDGVDPNDTVVAEFLADPATAKALATTPPPGEVRAEEFDAIYFAGATARCGTSPAPRSWPRWPPPSTSGAARSRPSATARPAW